MTIAENALQFHSIKHTIAAILASKVFNILIVKSPVGSFGDFQYYAVLPS
jgi:hypothetical protein